MAIAKAVRIQWDVDDPKDLELLPKSIDIPEEILQQPYEDEEAWEEAISDYVTDKTGFCHNGFIIEGATFS